MRELGLLSIMVSIVVVVGCVCALNVKHTHLSAFMFRSHIVSEDAPHMKRLDFESTRQQYDVGVPPPVHVLLLFDRTFVLHDECSLGNSDVAVVYRSDFMFRVVSLMDWIGKLGICGSVGQPV